MLQLHKMPFRCFIHVSFINHCDLLFFLAKGTLSAVMCHCRVTVTFGGLFFLRHGAILSVCLLVRGEGYTTVAPPGSHPFLPLLSPDREDHDTDRRRHRFLQRSAIRRTRYSMTITACSCC